MLKLSRFYGVSIKSQHCIVAHKLPPQLSVSRSSDGFVLWELCSRKEGLFGVFHTSASFLVNKTANLLNWISSAADYIVKRGPLWKKAIRDTVSLEERQRERLLPRSPDIWAAFRCGELHVRCIWILPFAGLSLLALELDVIFRLVYLYYLE